MEPTTDQQRRPSTTSIDAGTLTGAGLYRSVMKEVL